jgi:hypothetical protein
MVWTNHVLCCDRSILRSVFNLYLFLSSSVGVSKIYTLFPIDITRSFWKPVKNLCSSSVMPSDLRRYKLTVSWLCDDHIAADTFVVKGFRQRASTAPSPLCRKTTVFKYWRYVGCLQRAGLQLADGDGYRSKEPINMAKFSISHSPSTAIHVRKRRTPLLNMYRLCGSPVSWVR